MKLKTLTVLILLFTCLNANAQIDAIKITNAKTAYEANDYQTAITELNTVSAVGKKSKLYLYYQGYSYYSLQQLDSAKKYLKKYLILDIKNKKAVEDLTNIENRLKWFAEAPPRQETINWLKSKIDNIEFIDESNKSCDDIYKYKFTDSCIESNTDFCIPKYEKYNGTFPLKLILSIDEIYAVYKTPITELPDGSFIIQHIIITTSGNKITHYRSKKMVEKTWTWSLNIDFDSEPGLLNKIYKAFSNLALENVKNMPKETY